MSSPFLTDCAEINGATIHYRLMGAGPPLILLHAGVADASSFRAQADAFAQHCRVLVYDARGCGLSPMPVAPYSHHEDLRALMDHVGIEKAALLGKSMGGKTSINFALAYPDRVRALILVGAAIEGFSLATEQTVPLFELVSAAFEVDDRHRAAEIEMQMWLVGPNRDVSAVETALREKVIAMLLNNFELEIAGEGAIELSLEPPALNRLSEIDVPTLVIVGEYDIKVMQTIANRLAAELPNAQQIILPDTAHLPNIEQPDAFNQIVLSFLAKT